MIIGLAGRKGSGKTELANVCIKKNFIHLPMAGPLKKIVSNIVGFNIDESQETKKRIINMTLTEKQIEFLSKETEIPIQSIKKENITFYDVRDALQKIGTDIIRKYNPNWHVNEISKMVDDKHNYIIDDVRFPNELYFVRKNGECYFIIRPDISELSNHASEKSLKWPDFGSNIIINNIPLLSIKKKWSYFIDNVVFNKESKIMGCKTNEEVRYLLNFALSIGKKPEEIAEDFKTDVSFIMMEIQNLMLPYPYFYQKSKMDYFINFKYSDDKTIKIINKELTIKEKGKRKIIASNPIAIENCKQFLK